MLRVWRSVANVNDSDASKGRVTAILGTQFLEMTPRSFETSAYLNPPPPSRRLYTIVFFCYKYLLSKYGQDVYNLYLYSFFIFILKGVTHIQQQDKLLCGGFALVAWNSDPDPWPMVYTVRATSRSM